MNFIIVLVSIVKCAKPYCELILGVECDQGVKNSESQALVLSGFHVLAIKTLIILAPRR